MKGPQLVDVLAHPNGWWRDKAQQIIVERNDRSAIPALQEKAERAPDWRTRLHALWTLDGIDAVEPALVTKALDDSSRDVRVAAVRIAERWLADPKQPIQAAVLKKIDDKDWAVRRQLAASLGALPEAAKIPALVTMLERHGDDPMTVDAAVSGLSGSEHVVLERLLAATEPTRQRTGALVVLAATLVRGGQDARLQELFALAGAPGRLPWQRDALLEGAEAALLGGPLPGTGRRGGGGRGAATAAANSNAPGGRAGPGGAPAFPGSRPGGEAPAAGRGRGATAGVPVSREPAALAALAAAGGETGKRAQALLARLTWPGKPAAAGAEPAAAPLTAAEQKRFEEGKGVYTTLCVACHNENGEGRDKLGPSLIGSPFVLSQPHVPMRILLNGKEGPVGLMPPLGTTLSDDQIAGVLTFVRRSWGNQGSAVDPAGVADVRKQTSGRTRAWTEKELLEMTGK
jgi:mono/diheme cytochrome c family protein